MIIVGPFELNYSILRLVVLKAQFPKGLGDTGGLNTKPRCLGKVVNLQCFVSPSSMPTLTPGFLLAKPQVASPFYAAATE